MSRSRDLANLAGDATGLETLTVSDITDLTASATELNYVDGVGSALQTQINAKAPIASPTFTGTTNISSGVTLPSNPTITLGSNATISKSGMVVKVENDYSTSQQAVLNNATHDLLTIDFVRVSSSSHFVLIGNVCLGTYSSADNQDSVDPRILLRENNAGAGEATININSTVTGNGFYRSDVPMFKTSKTHSGLYDVHHFPLSIKRSLSGSAGDTINFKIRIQGGSVGSGSGVYTNRSQVTNTSGGHSALTIMEVIN